MKKSTHLLVLIVIMCIGWSNVTFGQLTQFTQNYFTNERVNPATISFAGMSSFKLLHRRQTFLSSDRLTTNYLSANFSDADRTTGISISYVNDQSNNFNLFTTNELAVNVARAADLTKFSKLSLGVGYHRSKSTVDLSGLTTSSQFVPGRGFNQAIQNGELMNDFTQSESRLHMGLAFQKVNKDEFPVLDIGVSVRDFNLQAIDSDVDATPASLIANVTRKVAVGRNNYVGGEVYFNRINTDNSLIVGAVFDHLVNWSQKNRFWHDELSFIARYHTIGYASFAMQVRKEALTIGLSHDFYRGSNPINNGTEVSLSYEFASPEIRFKKRKRNKKRKRKSNRNRRPVPPPVRGKSTANRTPNKDETTEEVTEENPTEEVTDNPNIETKDEKDDHHDFSFEMDKLYLLTFEFGSYQLTETSQAYIDYVKGELKNMSNYKIIIYGHTDDVGSEDDNYQLSLNRANTVKTYLKNHGFDTDHMEVIGKGESEPIARNDTEQGRSENRRVEIKVVKEGKDKDDR
ncbi:MAG: OmpA family protein [Bacteroidota bacterium]